jgi:hypothetical protein
LWNSRLLGLPESGVKYHKPQPPFIFRIWFHKQKYRSPCQSSNSWRTNPWDAHKHGVEKYTYQASTWLILASILPLTNIDSFVISGGVTSTVTGLAWASVLLFMKSYPENEWRLWFMVKYIFQLHVYVHPMDLFRC